MAFVPAPSTCLVKVEGLYYGDTIINDIYVKKIASAYSDADMIDVLGRVNTWWNGDVLPLLNVNYVYNRCEIRDISVPTGRVFEDTSFSGEPGGIAGNGSPGNVTYRIFFKTGFPVRGGRPGNAVSGLTQTNVIGNTINNTWAGQMHAAYNLLGPDINGGAVFYWATVSKIFNKLPRTEAAVLPITSTSYNTKVHTMGKRINGK